MRYDLPGCENNIGRGKKKEWRNWLKAVGYFVLVAALIAAVVIGTEQLGI